jgi:dihydroorotate dehydrogenase electron transfer subunit
MDDAGLRVCKDGPVFNGKELVGSEFGKYTRGPSGQKKLF